MRSAAAVLTYAPLPGPVAAAHLVVSGVFEPCCDATSFADLSVRPCCRDRRFAFADVTAAATPLWVSCLLTVLLAIRLTGHSRLHSSVRRALVFSPFASFFGLLGLFIVRRFLVLRAPGVCFFTRSRSLLVVLLAYVLGFLGAYFLHFCLFFMPYRTDALGYTYEGLSVNGTQTDGRLRRFVFRRGRLSKSHKGLM